MLVFLRQSLASLRTQHHGFDPLRTLTQILVLQTTHYLFLFLLVPLLLRVSATLFPVLSDPALSFEGGSAQLAFLLDWRELAGRPTWDWNPLDRPSVSWSTEQKHVAKLLENASKTDKSAILNAWTVGSIWLDDDKHEHAASSTGAQNDTKNAAQVELPLVLTPAQVVHAASKEQLNASASDAERIPFAAGLNQRDPVDTRAAHEALVERAPIGEAAHEKEVNLERWEWEHTRDPARGYVLAAAWLLSAIVDIQALALFIRRPTLILDHVMTLHLLHLLISAYYASSLPTSLFWWVIMAVHAALCSLFAERICIKRELGAPTASSVASALAEEEGTVPTRRTADLHYSDHDEARHHSKANGKGRAAPHVLFDEDDVADSDSTTIKGGESYEMKVRPDKAGHAD